MMIAAIRIKGRVHRRRDIEDTLAMLRLNRKMHCVVLKESPTVKGMLQKVKDVITWGEVDEDTLRMMIVKRGRKAGNKKLTAEEAESAFNDIKVGKKPPIKPVFRLTPPSKGFKKSVKQHVEHDVKQSVKCQATEKLAPILTV